MHSSQYFSTILFVFCALRGISALPLGLTHPPAEGLNEEHTEYLNTIIAAKDKANTQIAKMETVLNDPGRPTHRAAINAAFGTHSSLDINAVKANVQRLKTGSIPVELETYSAGSSLGVNHYYPMEPGETSARPRIVAFSKKFHKSTSVNTHAATLIHEATHFLADTGDDIHNGKMLKGGNPLPDKRKPGDKELSKAGASKQNPHKTVKSLNGDTVFTQMRDGHTDKDGVHGPTQNMHDNAESYNQFASICDNLPVRRDLHAMYRRALGSGDDKAAMYYLFRRKACALSKNHFAKKAPAKKAANAKVKTTGAKTVGAKAAGSRRPATRVPSRKLLTPTTARQAHRTSTHAAPAARKPAVHKAAARPGAHGVPKKVAPIHAAPKAAVHAPSKPHVANYPATKARVAPKKRV
ncbi:hypothetical protein BDZ97DRAFT_1920879 [Flammula alnicola]|nr:hypothetical protein BDZ97DRAFT_1920879 [Flammula alnicola]